MRLGALLHGIRGLKAAPALADLDVKGLSDDSRRVKRGQLFASLPPASAVAKDDRPAHLKQALAKGAALVLSEKKFAGKAAWLACAPGSTRHAWARICSRYYAEPAWELFMAGITGTNGKTTTAYLSRSLLHLGLGAGSSLVGTIEYRVGGVAREAHNTTPGSLELARIASEAWAADDRSLVMEVSSHALDQSRVDGLAFDVAVFSNLTQDHLDYHKTFSAYAASKARLFGLLKPGGLASLNADDAAWKKMDAARPEGTRRLLYSAAGKAADLKASSIRFATAGSRFTAVYKSQQAVVKLGLPGRFNISNALAALSIGLAAGIPFKKAAGLLAKCEIPPGRFEAVSEGQGFGVIVDYAHTPDALQRLLDTAREITPGRLIVVFGCGGDRDRTKRPKMGAIAAGRADLCIITSDNPRSEDPEAIIDEVYAGVPPQGAVHTILRLADRSRAIRRAIKVARKGDCVVIAGKGHEDYQIVGRQKLNFSDRAEAQAALRAYGA